MTNVFIGLFIMLLIYLLYRILIIGSARRLEKYIRTSREVNLVKAKYKIDYKKKDYKFVARLFAVSNALIIGVTYMIVMQFGGFIVKFLIAFVILIILLIISYTLIGNILIKKEGK